MGFWFGFIPVLFPVFKGCLTSCFHLVLDALYMDEMVKSIHNWIKSPTSSSVGTEKPQNTCDNLKYTEDVYILIVEGFLLYNYE